MSKLFDKYAAYAASVQSPDEDVRVMRKIYRELVGREPVIMREDFCAAFALCCEWVKLDPKKRAIGLDIDPEPLAYGAAHYLPLLNEQQQSRVNVLERSVLSRSTPEADIICALNFSYFIFHKREVMLSYFKACRRSLRPGGLFMVDVFGGPGCEVPSVDVNRLPGLIYYWEQENFDPINHHARFHIHFKPKGGRVRKRCFTYDWRMWSIAEIRDLMTEAGFKDSVVYWEGTSRDGGGSGKYHRRERGEACRVWMAYILGRT